MSSAFEQYCGTLSEKGITVVYNPRATTASYSVNTKTVTMPTFEWFNESVKQHLLSHESSHALHSDYTLDVFTEMMEKYGDIFNIVEDCRIEKLIKLSYPGLNQIFKDSFTVLAENDFFGKDVISSISKGSFLDRLNIFFKSSGMVKVPFSPEESKFVFEINACQTKEDCIRITKELFDYIKNHEESTSASMDFEDILDGSYELEECEEGDYEQDQECCGAEQNQKCGLAKQNKNQDGEKGEKGESSSERMTKNASKPNPFVSSTQKHFNKKMEEYGRQQKENNTSNMLFPEISSKKVKDNFYANISDQMKIIEDIYVNYRKRFNNNCPLKSCDKLIEKVKIASKVMTSIFRKKADANNIKMTKFKNSGSLNMSRLAFYKTSENLFKRISIQPNQENHGIVILIDLSGSMNRVLSGVLFQTAIITDFCMVNNIPFEVLGFGAYFAGGQGLDDVKVIKIADNLHYSIVGILNFTPEVLEQLRHWCNSHGFKNWDMLKSFYMGETPLDAGLIVAVDTFKKYKIAGVDKTILVVITDGDYKISTEIWNNGYLTDNEYHFPTWFKTIIDNEEINTSDYLKIEKKLDNTTDFYVDNIVWYIKKHFNTVTIFSFLSDISYLNSLENDIKRAVKQNFGEVEIGGFIGTGYGYRKQFTYFEKTLKRMKCSDIIQLIDDDKINKGHPVDFGNGNGNPVWDKIFFQDYSFYISLIRNISLCEKGLKKSDTLEKIIKNFESLRNIKSILSYLGNILIQEIV